MTVDSAFLSWGEPQVIVAIPLEVGSWALIANVTCSLYTSNPDVFIDPGGIHFRLEVVGPDTTYVGADSYYQHVRLEQGSNRPIPSRGSIGLQMAATVGFGGAEARLLCAIDHESSYGDIHATGLTAIPVSGGPKNQVPGEPSGSFRPS